MVDTVEVQQVVDEVLVDGDVVTIEVTSPLQPATSLITTVEFLGSAMTGSDGDSGRTYTHSGNISSSARVYVGSPVSGAAHLPSSKWTLSTTSSANDTITINVPIYDNDQVILHT